MTATEQANYTMERCANPACRFRIYFRRLDQRPSRPMHPKRCPSCGGTEWTTKPPPDTSPRAAA